MKVDIFYKEIAYAEDEEKPATTVRTLSYVLMQFLKCV